MNILQKWLCNKYKYIYIYIYFYTYYKTISVIYSFNFCNSEMFLQPVQAQHKNTQKDFDEQKKLKINIICLFR